METKLATKETLRLRAKSARYWVSMIATAFNADCGEQMQLIYINELMKLDPKLLETAANRTIREWDRPAMMPPLQFILDRAVPPLPDGVAQLDEAWEPTQFNCDKCDGCGQLAVYFEETGGEQRRREFRQVMSYDRSLGSRESIPNTWIQFYFRCDCRAGDRRPTGLPRWKPEIREKTA